LHKKPHIQHKDQKHRTKTQKQQKTPTTAENPQKTQKTFKNRIPKTQKQHQNPLSQHKNTR